MSAGAVEQTPRTASAVPYALRDSLPAFVARYVAPGTAGAAMVTLGAFGVGWLPDRPGLADVGAVHVLRNTTLGTLSAGAVLVAGVTLLVFAWLQLGQDIRRGYVPELRRLWLTCVAWCVPLIISPPLFSRDVYSYVAQGKLVAAGIDPYQHGPSVLAGWAADGVDPLWADSPTPYGPLFLVFGRGIVNLSGPDPYLAAMGFRLLALVGVGLLAWAVPELARSFGARPAVALWLAVLNPLVLMHFVSGAHNDALMVGLIAAGMALTLRNRPFVGLLAVAAAGAVKPIGLLALPFVGVLAAGYGAPWRLIARRWLIACAVTLGLFVGLSLVTGTGWGWTDAVNNSSAVRTWLSPSTAFGMTLGSGFEVARFEVTDTMVVVCRTIGSLVALGVVSYLAFWRARNAPVRAAGLAFLVVVICGPVVQPWYLLWALPFLAVTLVGRIERTLRFVIIGTVALSTFTVISHFLDGAGYM